MEPNSTPNEEPKEHEKELPVPTSPESAAELSAEDLPTPDKADELEIPDLSELNALDAKSDSGSEDSDSKSSVVDNTIDVPVTHTPLEKPMADPIDVANARDDTDNTPSVPVTPMPVFTAPIASMAPLQTDDTEAEGKSPKRFLLAYIVSIFSALTLLVGGSILGYALFNQFLEPEKDSSSFFFDTAPLYLSIMSTMIIFVVLYFLASQYMVRATHKNDVAKPDWRVYKVAYAIFAAILLTSAAGVLASLLYIPLSNMFVTEDLAGYQIGVQVLGGLHVLLWVGLLIWQERLIKRGRNAWFQGSAIVLLTIVLTVLAGIFLISSKTDQRIDARTSTDLSTIASKIAIYESNHKGELPKTLDDLDFKSTDMVKKRIADYKYTVKTEKTSSSPLSSTDFSFSIGATYNGSMNELSNDTSSFNMPSNLTNNRYELCADFRTDTSNNDDGSDQPTPLEMVTGASFSSSSSSFAIHPKGQACFDR